MPTAPESLPKASCSKAFSSRARLRSASKAKPARRRPKVVGSAWTPWVRPTQSVSRVLAAPARPARRGRRGRPATSDLARLAQLQRQRRVEHVGGGEPVVDPAPVLADRLGDDVDEGGDVVVGGPLALVDRLDRERRAFARAASAASRGHRRPPRPRPRSPPARPRARPPCLRCWRPDGADLLARVAGDHVDSDEQDCGLGVDDPRRQQCRRSWRRRSPRRRPGRRAASARPRAARRGRPGSCPRSARRSPAGRCGRRRRRAAPPTSRRRR